MQQLGVGLFQSADCWNSIGSMGTITVVMASALICVNADWYPVKRTQWWGYRRLHDWIYRSVGGWVGGWGARAGLFVMLDT